VAEAMDLSLESYQDVLTEIHGAALLNLDASIRDSEGENGGGKTFQDQLIGTDNPEEKLAEEELKARLAGIIATLSEKEQMVLSLYYFEDLTLKEIGEVLERTESRICQIHSAALVKLRARLRGMTVDV
jgi:RNA polymerase sigma factor for flagellar operon FliA